MVTDKAAGGNWLWWLGWKDVSTLGSEWLELLPRSKVFCTLPEDSAPLLKCRGREVPLNIALVAACMPTPLLPTKSRGEQIFCFGKL